MTLVFPNWKKYAQTYQPNEYAEELYDVGVSDRVEPTEECIEEGDAGWEDDGSVVVQVDDDADCGTWIRKCIIINKWQSC